MGSGGRESRLVEIAVATGCCHRKGCYAQPLMSETQALCLAQALHLVSGLRAVDIKDVPLSHSAAGRLSEAMATLLTVDHLCLANVALGDDGTEAMLVRQPWPHIAEQSREQLLLLPHCCVLLGAEALTPDYTAAFMRCLHGGKRIDGLLATANNGLDTPSKRLFAASLTLWLCLPARDPCQWLGQWCCICDCRGRCDHWAPAAP
eukprot:scaffold298582_cov26-Tisochrysis_lutea.AAC.1